MALELIQTNTLVSSAGSIVFNTIPQTYETLWLKAQIQDSNGGLGRNDFRVAFNSDNTDGSGYYGKRMLFYDGNTRLGDITGGGGGQGATHAMPQSGNGPRFTGIDFWIPNYTSTVYHKQMHSIGGYGANTNQVFLNLVSYNNSNNTQAITSITFTAAGGLSFSANSKISLYGIK